MTDRKTAASSHHRADREQRHDRRFPDTAAGRDCTGVHGVFRSDRPTVSLLCARNDREINGPATAARTHTYAPCTRRAFVRAAGSPGGARLRRRGTPSHGRTLARADSRRTDPVRNRLDRPIDSNVTSPCELRRNATLRTHVRVLCFLCGVCHDNILRGRAGMITLRDASGRVPVRMTRRDVFVVHARPYITVCVRECFRDSVEPDLWNSCTGVPYNAKC